MYSGSSARDEEENLELPESEAHLTLQYSTLQYNTLHTILYSLCTIHTSTVHPTPEIRRSLRAGLTHRRAISQEK